MPIGLVSPQPLSVGLSPTAPATVAAPVVTPDAVAQLVDAFHKGVITSQDLVSHIGTVATAKNRALLQEMGEYTSPGAIQARQSALGAQTAQNNLVTQQAQASAGLVQPAAELAGIGTQKNIASAIQGPTGLDAIQQYGHWFGKTMDDYKQPNGTYDFNAAAKDGTQLAAQMNIANTWIQRLTPISDRPVTSASGAKYVQKVNQWGVDVTPPAQQPDGTWFPGSQAYQAYVKELGQYLPDAHPAWQQFMKTSKGTPDNGANGHHPSFSGAPEPAATSLVAPNVATPTAVAPPVIEPQVSSAPGIQTEEAKGAYQAPDAIRAAMVADPIVKTLLEQQKYSNNFKAVADRMEQDGATQPGAKGLPAQNNADIGLAESIIKLYDPTSRIVEFKWDKLEDSQPLLEKIGAWKQGMLRSGTFTPEARQRLIQMGDDMVSGMEASARGRIGIAANAASSSAKVAGQDPQTWVGQTVTPDEQRILNGQPFRTPKAGAAPAARPPGTAPARRVVVFKSGPYAGRQMSDNGDGTFSPAQ